MDAAVPPEPRRVSDAERERVVDLLKERTADGTLTLEEFAGRVDRALTARSTDDLAALVADVAGAAATQRPKRSARHRVIAVMGGAHTKGRWRCDDSVTAVAVMGGCQLDFRNAEISVPEVHVTAVAVMGGVHIIVPEGVDVTMSGMPIMGGRSLQVKDVPILPGSPRIVVHALPIMGGVTVQSRPRKQRRTTPDAPAVEAPAAPPVEGAQLPLDGTVTIMFSDVCDYSGITDRLGDREAHELLREHNRIVREHVNAQGGREVKSNGDGFMVAFGSAARAIRCAAALRDALAQRNAESDGEAIRVHIGIHAGDVVRDGDDFLGSTVIIASRLADMAGPEEILVSAVARALAEGSREFSFDDARVVRIKGFTEAREAYPVSWARDTRSTEPTLLPPRRPADEAEAV